MNTPIALLTTAISTLAASISSYVTYRTWRDAKSDERLLVSSLQHPELRNHEHSKSVLWCLLLNKSKRKVEILNVSAYDNKNESIRITWSNKINDLGSPQNPSSLIGVVDSEYLFMRRSDGKDFNFCKLEIHHSFPSSPYKTTFDEYSEWDS